MKDDEKVPSREGIISQEISPSLMLLSFFISCFLQGESPQSLSVLSNFMLCHKKPQLYLGAEIQLDSRVEEDPCLDSHHAPLSPEPCDLAVLPQACFVKHSVVVDILRSRRWEEPKTREGKYEQST